MPLTQSPPDALARVYAASLFELAKSAGGQPRIEEILGELDDLLQVALSDAAFGEFLASRILPVEARAASLQKIFKGRVSDTTLNFLLVLNAKDRLGHLPAIIAAYDQLVQDAFGRVEVDVYTPAPIETSELAMITDRLKTVLGREPVVHPYTEPAMLGGVKLQIGDRLIDASIATRLRRLREQLQTDGAARVRAASDRMID